MDEAAPQAAREHAAADAELSELLGSITVGMLRETFDHWTIATANGQHWAFRTGDFTAVGPRSLIRACVAASTVTGLADQLCLQAWLESLSAAELGSVWRDGIAAVAL